MSESSEDIGVIGAARRDVVSSLITGVLAVSVFYYGTTLRGDSGMFPMLIGAVMLFGSLGLGLKALMILRHRLWTAPRKQWQREDWLALRQISIAAAGLLLYALLVRPLGFFSSTALMMLALPHALGYRHLLGIAINAVVVLAMLYLIFIGVFERPLPREFFLR
nr:tripartite tricarboxylate transporter TctB family protein [Halomonas socia]